MPQKILADEVYTLLYRPNSPLNDAKRNELFAKNNRRRKADMYKAAALYLDECIDNLAVINPENMNASVIFGAYGPDEWATSSHLREKMEQGISTLADAGTWITPDAWALGTWVMKHTKRFNFMSKNRAILFFDWGIIEATSSRGKLQLELNGEVAGVQAFVTMLDAELKRAENLIEWVYGSRNESVSLPLNYRPAIPAAYPWIKQSLDSYMDEYLASRASVLILLGPPGTGKTTFIKNLIHRSGGDAKVTYDAKVMNDDALFANFMEREARFLVMEDADAFLKSREDGNTMMHRFLNVSDGLISTAEKKLVFSTNLPSIRDIDVALMRPGRCFDVLEFRSLTRPEAQAVAEATGLTLPDGTEFTLAELFNEQPSSETRTRRGMGFV